MIHGQGVNHLITPGQYRLCTFSWWMVAGQIVQEKVLYAVCGEEEKDCGTASDQANQDAEDDRASQ